MSAARAVRPGFTLLEMLVALTLLAFIVVMGQQAIALAARAAVPTGDGGNGFLVRHQIMDWVETSIPVRVGRRDRAPLVFIGEPNRLQFVTSLPGRLGVAGPHMVTFARAPGPVGGLAMVWQPLRPPPGPVVGADQPAAGPGGGERIVLEGVQGVGFRYWDGTEGGGWLDVWPPNQKLPAMIQMVFDGGSAEGWPPMLVALRNRGG